MTVSHVLFVLLLCVLTGSFTWGMRGTLIGGERGAMLPGAALAMILLFAGGSAPVASAFPMFAVIGACGMFFGGSQTYGETIGLTKDSDMGKRRLGRIGLAVKGGGWFGVYAGILSFGFGTAAGRYALWETILFVVLLPVVRQLGILLLNRPYKPDKKVFPKLYFSESRREVWGGMLLMMLYILIFSACKREWFAIWMIVFGCVFGAAGFVLGNLLQNAADAHLPAKFFSGWKAMECTFGAVGALGVGLCWCLFYNRFVTRYTYDITAHSGAWTPFPTKLNTLLGFIWLVLLSLFILRYWLPLPGSKKSSRLSKAVFALEDVLIYPVFCLYPLFLAAAGDLYFAQIFSLSGMVFLLPDKLVFGTKARYGKNLYALILHAVLVLLTAAALFLQIFFDATLSAYGIWMVWLLGYLLVTYAVRFDPVQLREKRKKHGSIKDALSGSEPTWMAYAGLCVAALLILGKSYFSL